MSTATKIDYDPDRRDRQLRVVETTSDQLFWEANASFGRANPEWCSKELFAMALLTLACAVYAIYRYFSQ